MAVVLVVGGAGFIGSHLVSALLAQAHTVRVLDNLSTGSVANLRAATEASLTRPVSGPGRDARGRLHLVCGDVRDPLVVWKAMRGVDCVFHHAAPPRGGGSPRQLLDTARVDVDGTLNVLRAAKAEGVRRVVYASSWVIYGRGQRLPLREDLLPVPRSPYAASKVAGETYCRAYWEAYRLETVCLRYFTIYGPGQSGQGNGDGVVARLILDHLQGTPPMVHGDRRQGRDLVFVEDAVRATLAAAAVPGAAGRHLNVATGHMVSLTELLETLGAVTGRPLAPRFAPARDGEAVEAVGDPTLARKLLDLTPLVTLSDGLRLTVEHLTSRLEEPAAVPLRVMSDA